MVAAKNEGGEEIGGGGGDGVGAVQCCCCLIGRAERKTTQNEKKTFACPAPIISRVPHLELLSNLTRPRKTLIERQERPGPSKGHPQPSIRTVDIGQYIGTSKR